MARPENIANSKISGTTTPIALVATAELKAGETKLKVSEKPPTGLEAAGQFRIIIGSEILLVTGGQTTEEWTVERNVGENSKEANHPIGTPIYHCLTKEALELLTAPTAFKEVAAEHEIESEFFNELGESSVTIAVPTSNTPIAVIFRALVATSIEGNGRVAVFVNGTQVSRAGPNEVYELSTTSTASTFALIQTTSHSLVSESNTEIAGTHPALIGSANTFNPFLIFPAATGKQIISVRFRATLGKIKVKNQALWAAPWT